MDGTISENTSPALATDREMVTLPGPDWHGPWQVPADATPHMVNGLCYGYIDGPPGIGGEQRTAAEVAAQLKAST